jgi:hypothetical protein
VNAQEIKSLLKKSDVYELDPNATHLIIIDRKQMPMDKAQSMAEGLKALGVKSMLIFVDDARKAIRVLEIKCNGGQL